MIVFLLCCVLITVSCDRGNAIEEENRGYVLIQGNFEGGGDGGYVVQSHNSRDEGVYGEVPHGSYGEEQHVGGGYVQELHGDGGYVQEVHGDGGYVQEPHRDGGYVQEHHGDSGYGGGHPVSDYKLGAIAGASGTLHALALGLSSAYLTAASYASATGNAVTLGIGPFTLGSVAASTFGKRRRRAVGVNSGLFGIALQYFDTAMNFDMHNKCLPRIFCEVNHEKVPGSSLFARHVRQLTTTIPNAKVTSGRPSQLILQAAVYGAKSREQPGACTKAFPKCPHSSQIRRILSTLYDQITVGS